MSLMFSPNANASLSSAYTPTPAPTLTAAQLALLNAGLAASNATESTFASNMATAQNAVSPSASFAANLASAQQALSNAAGLPPKGSSIAAVSSTPTSPAAAPTGFLATKIAGSPVTVGEAGIGVVALGVLYKVLGHHNR